MTYPPTVRQGACPADARLAQKIIRSEKIRDPTVGWCVTQANPERCGALAKPYLWGIAPYEIEDRANDDRTNQN